MVLTVAASQEIRTATGADVHFDNYGYFYDADVDEAGMSNDGTDGTSGGTAFNVVRKNSAGTPVRAMAGTVWETGWLRSTRPGSTESHIKSFAAPTCP